MTPATKEHYLQCVQRVVWCNTDADGLTVDCAAPGYVDADGNYIIVQARAVFMGKRNKSGSPTICYQTSETGGRVGVQFTYTDTDNILCFVDATCGAWVA